MLPIPRHCPACNNQWMGRLDSQCKNCFPRASLLEGTTEQHAIDWHSNEEQTAVAGLVVKNGKILLSQRDDYHSNFWGRWQDPGGSVEPKEHPRDAVTRELKEENDIDIKVVKWICNTMISRPASKLLIVHYLCTTQDEPVETIESLRPEWCDPIVLKDGSRPLMTGMNAVKEILYDAVAEYLFDLQSDNAGGDRKP